MNKNIKRQRRATKTRAKIASLEIPRLCVHRTLKNIYVQLIGPNNGSIIASASSLDKNLRNEIKYGGNKQAANVVGKLIAERCLTAGIKRVAFDRSGFKYHGRIKALADAAREAGIEF